MYKKSLFIFRRDLRLEDNIGLNEALRNSAHVIPCFIFDLRQLSPDNEFRSLRAITFMIESLLDLQKQLKHVNGKLYFFSGIAEEVVKKIIKQESIEAVYFNRDYTPFSIKRDEAIKKACIQNNVDFFICDDALLNPPESIKTQKNEPFSKFTPYYKKALLYSVDKPAFLAGAHFYHKPINDTLSGNIDPLIEIKNEVIKGGSKEAAKILRSLKKFKNYAHEHDFPSIATTHLSAHNKFGTVSIRTVYHAIKKQLGAGHPLLRQLYWRDFFTYVAYHSPFVFGESFYKKYEKLWWSDNKKLFTLWCEGKTGFPIVDAGMRELNQTGFMHNRVRLLVASFLVKDLHINWLWGERYFAQHLIDYDPAVNNGNWQWCASTGCDAQPYFRIFNPWLQQKKFDAECVYIKKWIPELKDVENATIHTWYAQKQSINNYPLPIVDHAYESKIAKKLFKNL